MKHVATNVGNERLKKAEERAVNNFTNQLFWDEQAQDLIEYALLSACLAVFCIAGILELTRIREFFSTVGAALGAAS